MASGRTGVVHGGARDSERDGQGGGRRCDSDRQPPRQQHRPRAAHLSARRVARDGSAVPHRSRRRASTPASSRERRCRNAWADNRRAASTVSRKNAPLATTSEIARYVASVVGFFMRIGARATRRAVYFAPRKSLSSAVSRHESSMDAAHHVKARRVQRFAERRGRRLLELWPNRPGCHGASCYAAAVPFGMAPTGSWQGSWSEHPHTKCFLPLQRHTRPVR